MLKMMEAGHRPNRVTYLAVMQAHSRAGRPSEVQPDERCLNALVLANAHAPPEHRKDPSQVAADFQRLVERGFPPPTANAALSQQLGFETSSSGYAAEGRTSATGRTWGAHVRQRQMGISNRMRTRPG